MKNNDSAESNLYIKFNNDVDNYDENNVKNNKFILLLFAKSNGLLRADTTIHNIEIKKSQINYNYTKEKHLPLKPYCSYKHKNSQLAKVGITG
jgi:hypothetical protein